MGVGNLSLPIFEREVIVDDDTSLFMYFIKYCRENAENSICQKYENLEKNIIIQPGMGGRVLKQVMLQLRFRSEARDRNNALLLLGCVMDGLGAS